MTWFDSSLSTTCYTKSYGGFKRVVRRLRKEPIKNRCTQKPKPYAKANYSERKVQIYVKYVLSKCVTDGKSFYEFIAVDEYSQWAYRCMYAERSRYSASQRYIAKPAWVWSHQTRCLPNTNLNIRQCKIKTRPTQTGNKLYRRLCCQGRVVFSLWLKNLHLSSESIVPLTLTWV